MKTRLILAFAVLAFAAGYVQAQTLEGVHLHLVRPGQEFGGVLIGPNKAFPASTQNDTFYLPAGGGTLLTSAAAGWQVGGQGLIPINPGLLGSTDAADVTLIAGGNTAANHRLTLLAGADAVLLPSQTELRLGDAVGGQYTAFMSPITLTGGSSSGNVTLVLPTGLPGGPDVRLQVATVDPVTGVVQLKYSNPNTTGSIGFKQINNQTDNGSNVNYIPVTGLTYEIGPNSIYSFETVVVVERVNGNANAEIIWGTPTTDAPPAGITMLYYEIQLNANNAGVQGDQRANVMNVLPGAAAPGNVYVLKGYIRTDGTTPANSIVQMRMRSSNNGDVMRVSPTSSVQLITE